MTIDEYLAELERRLPRIRRRRILTETAEHLCDSAARHRARGLAPHAADAAAVEDFGGVDVVAGHLASEVAVHETRIATALALGAVVFFVVPLYVVPENTLPPAHWVEKPRDILALQIVTVALWLAAVALGAASAALAWTRWPRLAPFSLIAAAGALACSALVSSALVVRWFAELPATPRWPLIAAPLAVTCLLACATAAGWARGRRGLLGNGVVQD